MTPTYFWLGSSLLAVAAWLIYWFPHGRKFQTSGYEPPAPSWFGQSVFYIIGRLVSILTVGPITVLGKENSPTKGRVIFVANHQVPSDFALLRRATGRHYRALGAASQFPGFAGLMAAFVGIVSVTFDTKEEKAAGEAAGVKVMSAKHRNVRLSSGLLLIALTFTAGIFLESFVQGQTLGMLISVALGCILMGQNCDDEALAIAPQGALLPDNQLVKSEFRPGVVRIARAAAIATGETVLIVPMAIHYKRDPKDAHWSHRFFAKTRSMFPVLRNPRHWDAAFKVNIDDLSEDERKALMAERKAKLGVYKRTKGTIYGGVVAVGKPIDASKLSADPIDAIEEIRLQIAALLEEAKQH